jgi:hypothetical protein
MQPFNLLSISDIATLFDVCERTVRNNVDAGDFPAPTKVLGKNFWHSDLLYDWLDQKMRSAPAAEPSERQAEPAVRIVREKLSAGARAKAVQARNLAKIAA